MLPVDIDALALKYPNIPRPCLETMVRIMDAFILADLSENRPIISVDDGAKERVSRIPLRLESKEKLPTTFKRAATTAKRYDP